MGVHLRLLPWGFISTQREKKGGKRFSSLSENGVKSLLKIGKDGDGKEYIRWGNIEGEYPLIKI